VAAGAAFHHPLQCPGLQLAACRWAAIAFDAILLYAAAELQQGAGLTFPVTSQNLQSASYIYSIIYYLAINESLSAASAYSQATYPERSAMLHDEEVLRAGLPCSDNLDPRFPFRVQFIRTKICGSRHPIGYRKAAMPSPSCLTGLHHRSDFRL